MGTAVLMTFIVVAAILYLAMSAQGSWEPDYPDWYYNFSLGEIPEDCQGLANEIQRLRDLLQRAKEELDRARTAILFHTAAAAAFSIAAASLTIIGVLAIAGVVSAGLAVPCFLAAFICGSAAAGALYNVSRWQSYFNNLQEIIESLERRLNLLYIEIQRCKNEVDLGALGIPIPHIIPGPNP